jgi:hypothetical protein
MLSFHLRVEHETPQHITVGLFAGKRPGSRGKCGTLTMRHDEWAELQDVLLEGGRARATVVQFSVLDERLRRGELGFSPEPLDDPV